MRYWKANLFIACSFLLLTSFKPNHDTIGIVKTGPGSVSGTTNKEGSVTVFKGIPFAAAPVGDLRWKAPQPVQPWTGVRGCETYGPSPMQASPAPFNVWTEEFLIPKGPINEDCLYLN